MLDWAESQGCSLGQVALVYETSYLSMDERQVMAEVDRRLGIMQDAVHLGLSGRAPDMQLLATSAPSIMASEAEGRVVAGGLHTRAAARAMAVMHVNAGKGVVCAAPTAGSAGTIPGVLVTLMEEMDLSREKACDALLAAGAIGLAVAQRATFAAEEAGCQVEIGAAGAMAAAAVVVAAGGTPRQATDAAAIAFQNSMGSICDLVQGMVEIPCHTRNAVAASSAFVIADLVLGGYSNPIPLDETIDAVYAVGQMLPTELKCTARGGLALAPSARAMPLRTSGATDYGWPSAPERPPGRTDDYHGQEARPDPGH
jgi:L-serine dehydratase